MPAEPAKFLTAEWRHLVMLNFEIDQTLKFFNQKIPAGTELDFWNGRTYVSIVGFRFLNTKLRGMAIPFHRHFSEVNLRFYVRRKVDGEWRRGVVFIKEIVPLHAVAFVARRVYNENYVTRRMRSRIALPGRDNSGGVLYEWKHRGHWQRLAASISGEPRFVDAASQEAFVTERYWGYTRQRDGGTVEYQVEHPPWRVWPAEKPEFDCDVHNVYGSDFAGVLARKPSSIFVAEGSAVVLRRGRRIE